MVLIPGNLSNVYQTCGTANCHLDIAKRVDHSLMTTMAGVITVDRFVFGEIDTLADLLPLADLAALPGPGGTTTTVPEGCPQAGDGAGGEGVGE
jgi:hypothetical protein